MDDIETTCDGISDSMMEVRHAQGMEVAPWDFWDTLSLWMFVHWK